MSLQHQDHRERGEDRQRDVANVHRSARVGGASADDSAGGSGAGFLLASVTA